MATPHTFQSNWDRRRLLVLLGFFVLSIVLVVRAAYLQVFDHAFYLGEGNARQQRSVAIASHRGNLTDRTGEPLAISTPIQSLWGLPDKLQQQPAAMREVAALLGIDGNKLNQRIGAAAERGREFVYIKRHVPPQMVDKVMALRVADLSVQREYRRYYPSGSAASHVIGFTDIDDRGREGLEMAYDEWLGGKPGLRRVVRDLNGTEISGINVVEQAIPGKDLRLSINKQLQYFADRALVDAVNTHNAESASVVIMKVRTGEVMAMANYPSYNPNDMADRSGGRQRNRSITDVFEPGSTMKPFTIAAALDSGNFKPEDIVYTSPGSYNIGKYKVSDTKDHGWLDLRGIVRKSSNVGVSKVATQLDPEQMWSVFDSFGFGRPPGSEFPGEVAGYFNHPTLWHHVEQASVSYGYGISVSALQLVRAYSALANDGVMPAVSFLAIDEPASEQAGKESLAVERTTAGRSADADSESQDGEMRTFRRFESSESQLSQGQRVIDSEIAREVRSMLESVVTDGTGHRARVPGYRVAGKTGTSHRSQSGGYAEDRYVSVFAGFAPVSDPELAAVVVVHDPKAGEHFGSVVSAPVFAEVMSHALRLGGIEPDDIDDKRAEASVLGDAEQDRS